MAVRGDNTYTTFPSVDTMTKTIFTAKPDATANYGLLSLGGEPFDGTSTSHFVGSSGGTVLAINIDSAFAGNVIDIQQDGVSQLTFSTAGQMSYAAGLGCFLSQPFTSGGGCHFIGTVGTGALTASTGTQEFVDIEAVIKQTGSAGYTGLLVNVTETTTGTGTKKILDIQNGGVSKFNVDNVGNVYHAKLADSTANYGILNIGDDPFDGTSAGHFAGTSSGTVIAANLSSALKDWVRFQVAGSDKFRIDNAGNVTTVGGFAFSPTTTTTAPSAGGAGALPATPTGYATVTIGGVARKIAYY